MREKRFSTAQYEITGGLQKRLFQPNAKFISLIWKLQKINYTSIATLSNLYLTPAITNE
jgi:hypothetical protein